jgi:hypothetical protein
MWCRFKNSTILQDPPTATLFNILLVNLQEVGSDRAGRWQWFAGCRGLGGWMSVVVGPAPAGGTVVPLHSNPSHTSTPMPQRRGSRVGVGSGGLVTDRREGPHPTNIDTLLKHRHTTDIAKVGIRNFNPHLRTFATLGTTKSIAELRTKKKLRNWDCRIQNFTSAIPQFYHSWASAGGN